MVLIGLALLAATACTDLPKIAPGVCGNGVIDVGEDCDGASDLGEGTACGEPEETNECFFVCTETNVCPDGWGCAPDGRCRRPTGELALAPGSPWLFRVNHFAVGDVDGDGAPDLVGNTQTTITARFGDGGGGFADDVTIFTPPPEGRLTFEDLSGDGRTDVVVPLESGISAFLGTAERTLEPVSYAPLPLEVEARLVPVPVTNIFDSRVMIFSTAIAYVESAGLPLPFPGGHTVADVAGRIAAGELEEEAGPITGRIIDGRFTAVLPISATREVWLVKSVGTDDPSVSIQDVDPGVGGAENPFLLPATARVGPRGAFLADIDSQNGLDVVIDTVSLGGQRSAMVAYNKAVGARFDQQPVPLSFDLGAESQEYFESPTVSQFLAAGSFDPDGFTDFITPGGVFLTCDLSSSTCPDAPGIPSEVHWSGTSPVAGTWIEAVVGDFNGDDVADFAAVIGDSPGVFVYLNSGFGLFNPFVVETDEPASNLRVGDFDGDLVADLAFTQATQAGEEVLVSFGQVSGGPSAAVSQGTFDSIINLEPAIASAALGFLDLVVDLILVSADPPDYSIAILRGSATRRMVSPFSLPAEGVVPKRALVGNFSGDGAPDLLAVTVPQGSDGAIAAGSQLFYLEGTEGGQFDSTSVEPVVVEDNLGFQVGCSRWAAANLDNDTGGLTELVGFDGVYPCGDTDNSSVIVANPSGGGSVASIDPVAIPDDGLRGIASIALADADADAFPDAVAIYDGVRESSSVGPPTGGGVAVYWNDAGTLGDSSSAIAMKGVVGAAPFQLDDDGVPELLVLTHDGLALARIDPESRDFDPLEMLLVGPNWQQLAVGDFNRDGLQDVALRFGDQVDIYLAVPAPPRGGSE